MKFAEFNETLRRYGFRGTLVGTHWVYSRLHSDDLLIFPPYQPGDLVHPRHLASFRMLVPQSEDDTCPCCGEQMGIYWECWSCTDMVCEDCIGEDRKCRRCKEL